MTTKHLYRLAFCVPIEEAEACNRAANALGRAGENFTVRLSATGTDPATHLGGSTVETDLFLATVAAAPGLPEGMDWPAALKGEDWQAVADHLTVVDGIATSTAPGAQFDAMLVAAGLVRIPADP